MKLGSFPMQILAVLFLQQPLLSGWNGPFLLVLNLRELRLGGSKLRAQDLNGGSASPTSPDPRSWNLPAEELFLWGGSRMFPGVQFVFPIAGGGACGQGGIAISEDFVGFALK